MSKEYHRILSLDGGGTWALIQVKTLMKLYSREATGDDVLKDFDLAVANSGGSIVLAALAGGKMTLAQILALFTSKDPRESIFKSLFFGKVNKQIKLGARYSAGAKLRGLTEALGDIASVKLRKWSPPAERQTRLVFCGFDYDLCREVFFRTGPGAASETRDPRGPLPRQQAVLEATFAEAVHASTNAPINYFDAPATWEGSKARFWDGAMGGYNNPVVAGIVELLRDKRVDRTRIRALSIGTGRVVRPEAGQASDPVLLLPSRGTCFVEAAKTASTCILDDPPDAASYVAHVTLGGGEPEDGKVIGNGPIIRMNPLVQPVWDGGRWVPPSGLDAVNFAALADLDMDAVEDGDVHRIEGLADLWLADSPTPSSVRNQPIRANRWLEVEIGHATLADAKAEWEKCCPPSATPPAPSPPP